MKLFGWVGVGIAVLLVSGCATARSTGLEPRVTALENKVQTLEADMRATTPSPMESLDTSSGSGRGSGSMSAAEMTKEDIQTALKNAGYYNGAVDGKIGPKTRAAIEAFQQDMGLKADGVAGKQTKEKLHKYLQ
jgi:peptidoglycan hydrolase-like protein with peptidoglycan-binding domain